MTKVAFDIAGANERLANGGGYEVVHESRAVELATFVPKGVAPHFVGRERSMPLLVFAGAR